MKNTNQIKTLTNASKGDLEEEKREEKDIIFLMQACLTLSFKIK